MKKETVIEMVLFKIKEGVEVEFAQKELIRFNEFLAGQEGFVSRQISLSGDGYFLDIVRWTDMEAAKAAVDKFACDPAMMETFSFIDEDTEMMKHFSIFNEAT